MKNLYLIGFMGAGKSTIARALAKKCPSKRIEMDQLIEEQQGMAITDILPHMERIISAIWRQSCCGLSQRAQDMWFPAVEAVYSGMRMRR